MNIRSTLKISIQLGFATALFATGLVSHEANRAVPTPVDKPALIASGAPVPVPAHKPDINETKLSHVIETNAFESLSLNLASLFVLESAEERDFKASHNYDTLSEQQSKLYQSIFKAQSSGDWEQADELIVKVKDQSLIGHVLSQRYLHPSYKTSFKEIQTWMTDYADYPDAQRLYDLSLLRKVEGQKAEIVKPLYVKELVQVREPMVYHPRYYASEIKRDREQDADVRTLSRKIRAFVTRGKTSEALDYFRAATEVRKYIDGVEHDQIMSYIAAGLLYQKRFSDALVISQQSADRSKDKVPQASWVAGLALWQKGEFAQAAPYFETVASSSYASGWKASAGAYWMARSYQKLGDTAKYNAALKEAAKHSRTFYGLLAAKNLRQDVDFNWSMPEFTQEDTALILSTSAGQRIFDLVTAQQYALAERELMRLNYTNNMPLRHAVLAYATHVGLPGIALRLGNMVRDEEGRYYDSAIYPSAAWEPKNGYKLDPALIHAVMRQESRFDLKAKSYSGALGLMQLMPKTAQYVSDMNDYGANLSTTTLKDPAMNMQLGQDYIEYLLGGRIVKGDMISLLVAYNAGPGNLKKWRARLPNNTDPLLMIEMLPVEETRDYVEHVLSNYWIYRMRSGQDAPSLSALAKGQSHKYAHVMPGDFSYQMASN